jgi:hypothetical protein
MLIGNIGRNGSIGAMILMGRRATRSPGARKSRKMVRIPAFLMRWGKILGLCEAILYFGGVNDPIIAPNLSHMNEKRLLAFGAALCLLAASCKKNSDVSSGNNGNSLNKVKMYIEETHVPTYNQIDTFYLSYDNNGRLTSMTGPTLKFVYAYTGSTSFTLDLFENGAQSIHELAYVKGSYIDSTFQYNSTHDTTTQKYLYNGNLLLSETDYDYTVAGGSVPYRRETYTYDNNGNMIKDVEDDGTGRINNTSTYTYTNKPLQFTINPTFYPFMSKMLPATKKVVDNLGTVNGIVTYEYVFDSAGRVTKETDTEDNGDYVIKSYAY